MLRPQLVLATYSATSSLTKSGQNVLDRMKNSGWGMPGEETKDDRNNLNSPQDSGYGENENESYLGGWNKLKKAVWNCEGDSQGGGGGGGGSSIMSRTFSNSSHSTSHTINTTSAATTTTTTNTETAGLYWKSVVASAVAASSVVSTSVSSAVQRARAEDDDFTVGPDGDTKLTRAIKEYHISRVSSAEELPTWLFPLSERRPQTQRPQNSPRSQSYGPERERDNRDRIRGGGGGGGGRPNYLQHSNTDYDSNSRLNDRDRDARGCRLGAGVSSRGSQRRSDEYRDTRKVLDDYNNSTNNGGGGGGGGSTRMRGERSSREDSRNAPSLQVVESSGSRTTDKLRAMSAAKRCC